MGSAASACQSPSLGRLLEIAISIEDPARALGMFGELGLREVPVADIPAAPRAVVSDGSLAIGLHGSGLPGPTPTFVRPDLRKHVHAIEAAGAELLEADLAEDRFHRAVFCCPDDLHVTLIEARTFPPVEPQPGIVSVCGRFAELSIATHSLEESTSFWARMGFAVVGESDSPHPSRRLEGHGLALGLHETGRFRFGLTFSAPQLDARLEYLRAKGFEPRVSSPLSADDVRSATLGMPGGVRLFLLDDDDDDEEAQS